MVLLLMKDFLSSIYTGCFLKNAANCSSVIYCPILINKRSNTMVKKILQNGLFFSTLTVMSVSVTLFFEMETYVYTFLL
jgi:hypothetical protein